MKTKGQYILMNSAELSEWLNSRNFARDITRVQNHHTWKPRYADFKGDNHFAMLEGMYEYHVDTNGWNNIGQNLTTFPDGLTAICRPIDVTPACIYGANKGAVCIEHVGDFDSGRDEMNKTHAQCIIRVNALLCREFGLTPNSDSIVYHHWYDLATGKRNNGSGNNKSCPGSAFFGGNKVADCEKYFIPKIAADLAVIMGAAGGGGAPASVLRRARVASPDGVLSIRDRPSSGGKKLDELKNGAVVDIFENDGKWCRVQAQADAWVHGGYLVAVALAEEELELALPASTSDRLKFDLPEPGSGDISKSLTLWGTYYYGQAAKVTAGGIPLRNKKDQVIGPSVSQRDWCLAAMEGTVVVTMPDGTTETFNYEGAGATAQTSCKIYFPNLNVATLAGTERVRWRRAKGPFGDGSSGFILSPYRTLAVDKSVIPLGTALYIDAARGTTVILPDGSKAKHDGYFFAADVGGAIKKTHVDFFLGTTSKNPFGFVVSKPQGTFSAAIVKNKETIKHLKALHTA